MAKKARVFAAVVGLAVGWLLDGKARSGHHRWRGNGKHLHPSESIVLACLRLSSKLSSLATPTLHTWRKAVHMVLVVEETTASAMWDADASGSARVVGGAEEEVALAID